MVRPPPPRCSFLKHGAIISHDGDRDKRGRHSLRSPDDPGAALDLLQPRPTRALRPSMLSGNISGSLEVLRMGSSGKSTLRSHRARMARRGFVRVEVNVRKEDANLIRDVAA